MAWCPKCKNEYREGVRICTDCGSELVEEEQYDNLEPLIFGDEEMLYALKKYLEYNDLKGVKVRYDETDNVYELLVRTEDKEAASVMARVFLQQEAQRDTSEEVAESVKDSKIPTMYRNSSEQAADNRSSAWTLMIVGGIGLIVMVLGLLDVIPFRLGDPYMFYGVMCSIFIIFIIMGVVSMKNAKIFAKRADSENTLRDAMTKWYQENLNADIIDAELVDEEGSEEISEEILYFKRVQKIKDKFNYQFMNLDQIFLEHYIDEEVYDSIFTH